MKNIRLRKIIIIAILSTILVSVLFTGCSNQSVEESAPEDTILATNEFADYTFYYPNDWELDSNTTFISVLGGGTAFTSATKSISVMVNDLVDVNQTPKEFWESNKSYYTGTFAEMTEVSAGKTTVGERDAYSVVYTAQITDDVYKFAQTFVIRSGTIYIITYTAKPDDFDESIEAYQTVLETFSFK